MLRPSSTSDWPGSVGKIKIAYYVVIKGRGYWRPSAKAKVLGFREVRCGPDGPEAWAVAKEWADRWERVRSGREESPAARTVDKATPETAEAAIVYPRGSLGEAFGRYRRTDQWTNVKAARTREDWWRGWRYIRPVFGDVDPNTVTLEMMDAWRAAVKAKAGEREAHRAMKIWRALWKAAAGMKYCLRTEDPSLAVTNTAAPGRSERWSEGEVVRLVKAAWREGFHGLAAIMAVIWDTQLSPGDARTLTAGALQIRAGEAFFTERDKTGTPVGGLLGPRTIRLLAAYRASLGIEIHPDAPVFRTRGAAPGPRGGRAWSPQPYTSNRLSEDFREIRTLVFGVAEARQLADFRRSGALEAIAGGAGAEQLSHAMGNTLAASNALFETYVPVNVTSIRDVAAARKAGRTKFRNG